LWKDAIRQCRANPQFFVWRATESMFHSTDMSAEDEDRQVAENTHSRHSARAVAASPEDRTDRGLAQFEQLADESGSSPEIVRDLYQRELVLCSMTHAYVRTFQYLR
jgi:hypothetical protein